MCIFLMKFYSTLDSFSKPTEQDKDPHFCDSYF